MYIYLQAVILSCSLYWKHADLQLHPHPPNIITFFSFSSKTNESQYEPETEELSVPAAHSLGSVSLAAFPF